jgi:integrase
MARHAISLVPNIPKTPNFSFSTAAAVTEARAEVLQIDDLEHTDDHQNCPACKAFNAVIQQQTQNIAELPFSEARNYWARFQAQATGLKASTHERNDAYLEALERFFGRMLLCDITPGHLRAYQIARGNNQLRLNGQAKHPWKRKTGHSTINHELTMLGRILDHCQLWAPLKKYYFPLGIPKWSPREIMTEEQEEQFFRDGASHPQAQLAYWVAAITNNTTASGLELRGLRLKHIFLRPASEISEIYIPPESVKNDSRPRKIALNNTAKWAIKECLKRAVGLGCYQPDHFLFPFRLKRGKYNPTRQAGKTFLRKSWAKLLEITGHPELKPHDLRHHCITRLLEEGVDPETVRAISGHLTPAMTEYYSHHRAKAKYRAVKRIEPARPAPSKPDEGDPIP